MSSKKFQSRGVSFMRSFFRTHWLTTENYYIRIQEIKKIVKFPIRLVCMDLVKDPMKRSNDNTKHLLKHH